MDVFPFFILHIFSHPFFVRVLILQPVPPIPFPREPGISKGFCLAYPCEGFISQCTPLKFNSIMPEGKGTKGKKVSQLPSSAWV